MNPRENLAPPPEIAKPLDQRMELGQQLPEGTLSTSEIESLQRGLQEVNSQIVYAEQQLDSLKSSLHLSNLDQLGRHIRGFEKQETEDVQTKIDYQRQIEGLDLKAAA